MLEKGVMTIRISKSKYHRCRCNSIYLISGIHQFIDVIDLVFSLEKHLAQFDITTVLQEDFKATLIAYFTDHKVHSFV